MNENFRKQFLIIVIADAQYVTLRMSDIDGVSSTCIPLIPAHFWIFMAVDQ